MRRPFLLPLAISTNIRPSSRVPAKMRTARRVKPKCVPGRPELARALVKTVSFTIDGRPVTVI